MLKFSRASIFLIEKVSVSLERRMSCNHGHHCKGDLLRKLLII